MEPARFISTRIAQSYTQALRMGIFSFGVVECTRQRVSKWSTSLARMIDTLETQKNQIIIYKKKQCIFLKSVLSSFCCHHYSPFLFVNRVWTITYIFYTECRSWRNAFLCGPDLGGHG